MTILKSFPPSLLIFGLLLSVISPAEAAAQSQPSPLQVAQEVKVTLLSTNLSDGATVGEWGLSALVEVGDRCILFDAGRHPETVLGNAEELDVDLSCVTDVVLSHHHGDHNGGLSTLQEAFRKGNPKSFQRVHVAQGIFLPRPLPGGDERNRLIETRERLEALGIQFIEYSEPTEIFPGVWVTGPIQRTHPEANYNAQSQMLLDGKLVGDFIPESQGLSVLTPRGHVVLLGCGHAGVINTLEHVQSTIATVPIHAVIGGFHLFEAEEARLAWTAEKLASIGTENVIGAHCTGIEALYRLREGAHLTRSTAVVGAVGASFTFGKGIDPGRLAK